MMWITYMGCGFRDAGFQGFGMWVQIQKFRDENKLSS